MGCLEETDSYLSYLRHCYYWNSADLHRHLSSVFAGGCSHNRIAGLDHGGNDRELLRKRLVQQCMCNMEQPAMLSLAVVEAGGTSHGHPPERQLGTSLLHDQHSESSSHGAAHKYVQIYYNHKAISSITAMKTALSYIHMAVPKSNKYITILH